MLIDDGASWQPVATHGDSVEEIIEQWTATAAQAFEAARTEHLRQGLSPLDIEAVFGPAWTEQVRHIVEHAPLIQRRMAESLGETLRSEPKARLH
jgi:signal-transduction protein with cAMP-binding, CBS, and nucleotidyltransferase domain